MELTPTNFDEQVEQEARERYPESPILSYDNINYYKRMGYIAGAKSKAVQDKVAELEKQIPKWVSVEERLPEIGERVLIWNGNKIDCSLFNNTMKFEVEKNHVEGERSFSSYWSHVTHWMPLSPKPLIP